MLKKIKQFFKSTTETIYTPEDMSDAYLQSVWEALNQKGYQKRISQSEKLHENTNEFIAFLKSLPLSVSSVLRVHELGCGAGRNLAGLRKVFPHFRYSGNDLKRVSCFQFMDTDLAQMIDFKQQDTLGYLKQTVESGHQTDLLIASDHLMHLSRDIILDVYRFMADYASQWIFLREPVGSHQVVRPSREAGAFLWAADYFEDKFPDFRLMAQQVARHGDEQRPYTLMAFQRDRVS